MKIKLYEADISKAVANYVYQRLRSDERNLYTYNTEFHWRGKYIVVTPTKKAELKK